MPVGLCTNGRWDVSIRRVPGPVLSKLGYPEQADVDMARTGFHLACDLIWVRGRRDGTDARHRPRGRVRGPYTSLPAAIFMLAYAAGDSLIVQASKQAGIRGGTNENTPLGLGGKGLASAWTDAGKPLLARARVTPRRTGIHPWQLLEGSDLDAYLGDARSLRNRLAHAGTTDGAELRSPFLVIDGKPALPQMTLMLAEGLLQAAQDIAYLTRKAGPTEFPDMDSWEWVLPEQSATGMMPAELWRHPAFPLPEDPDG